MIKKIISFLMLGALSLSMIACSSNTASEPKEINPNQLERAEIFVQMEKDKGALLEHETDEEKVSHYMEVVVHEWEKYLETNDFSEASLSHVEAEEIRSDLSKIFNVFREGNLSEAQLAEIKTYSTYAAIKSILNEIEISENYTKAQMIELYRESCYWYSEFALEEENARVEAFQNLYNSTVQKHAEVSAQISEAQKALNN